MEWEFGVLSYEVTAENEDWRIEPLANYNEVITQWKNEATPEGWILPPVVETVKEIVYADGSKKEEVVPNTMRSAGTWRIPSTHKLIYTGGTPFDRENEREGIAGFLMHAIGCMYGIELQFEEWTVSGRMSLSGGGLFHPKSEAVSAALKILPQWYLNQKEEAQKVILNALFFHNHIPSYEKSWERFSWQYTVFDSCWNISFGRGGGTPHRKRLEKFADHLGLVKNSLAFDNWVEARNNLIHEATWGGNKVVKFYRALRNFTTMALLSVMSYKPGNFSTINWDTRARMRLDEP